MAASCPLAKAVGRVVSKSDNAVVPTPRHAFHRSLRRQENCQVFARLAVNSCRGADAVVGDFCRAEARAKAKREGEVLADNGRKRRQQLGVFQQDKRRLVGQQDLERERLWSCVCEPVRSLVAETQGRRQRRQFGPGVLGGDRWLQLLGARIGNEDSETEARTGRPLVTGALLEEVGGRTAKAGSAVADFAVLRTSFARGPVCHSVASGTALDTLLFEECKAVETPEALVFCAALDTVVDALATRLRSQAVGRRGGSAAGEQAAETPCLVLAQRAAVSASWGQATYLCTSSRPCPRTKSSPDSAAKGSPATGILGRHSESGSLPRKSAVLPRKRVQFRSPDILLKCSDCNLGSGFRSRSHCIDPELSWPRQLK